VALHRVEVPQIHGVRAELLDRAIRSGLEHLLALLQMAVGATLDREGERLQVVVGEPARAAPMQHFPELELFDFPPGVPPGSQ
jgi:hypothetical protein